MAKYIVKQSGPLRGEVFISGAKNAVLPLMAAALLAEEECVIRDVPKLRDVAFMKEILASHGAQVTELEENILAIKNEDIISTDARFELVNKMRGENSSAGRMRNRSKTHRPSSERFGGAWGCDYRQQ